MHHFARLQKLIAISLPVVEFLIHFLLLCFRMRLFYDFELLTILQAQAFFFQTWIGVPHTTIQLYVIHTAIQLYVIHTAIQLYVIHTAIQLYVTNTVDVTHTTIQL